MLVAARAAALDAELAIAEVTKEVALVPPASGVTTEVPIPGMLIAGTAVELAVTTVVLADDTIMTDTVAEGAVVVVVVVVP